MDAVRRESVSSGRAVLMALGLVVPRQQIAGHAGGAVGLPADLLGEARMRARVASDTPGCPLSA